MSRSRLLIGNGVNPSLSDGYKPTSLDRGQAGSHHAICATGASHIPEHTGRDVRLRARPEDLVAAPASDTDRFSPQQPVPIVINRSPLGCIAYRDTPAALPGRSPVVAHA